MRPTFPGSKPESIFLVLTEQKAQKFNSIGRDSLGPEPATKPPEVKSPRRLYCPLISPGVMTNAACLKRPPHIARAQHFDIKHQEYMHTYIHVYICVCMYVCIYIYVCLYVRACICMCLYILYMYMCVRTCVLYSILLYSTTAYYGMLQKSVVLLYIRYICDVHYKIQLRCFIQKMCMFGGIYVGMYVGGIYVGMYVCVLHACRQPGSQAGRQAGRWVGRQAGRQAGR